VDITIDCGNLLIPVLYQRGTGVVCFSFFFWLRVLDKAEYSAFESTLNSLSYRIVFYDHWDLRSWSHWRAHGCGLWGIISLHTVAEFMFRL